MKISVSTIAGGKKGFRDGKAEEALFHGPSGIFINKNGILFIAEHDQNRIRMISDGIVSTIAGCGQQGFRDGKAEDAMFNGPRGICVSDDGRIYISDRLNDRIRMISVDGIVSTIAGCGKTGFKDGKAEKAKFNRPIGICISKNHSIYIADSQNNRIRIISNGRVSTIAGCGQTGHQDGKAEIATFMSPYGICMSNEGNLYISDSFNNCIRMISNGMVSTIAGCGKTGFQDGKAENAMFNWPNAIIISNHGNIYVSDWFNHRIRMISDGMVSTIAGCGQEGFRDGNAEDAMFNGPRGIFMSDSGQIYVTDNGNNRIRLISGLSNPLAAFEYFELNSLIEASNEALSDITLTINDHHYELHAAVLDSLCPTIVKGKSTIEKAKISNQSLKLFFEVIYSNSDNAIRKVSQHELYKLELSDLTQMVELVWLFESFQINNQSLLSSGVDQFKIQLKYFMEQEKYESAMQAFKFDLLQTINDLIVLNKSEGLKASKLAQMLHFLIEQIKKQIENEQESSCTNENNEDVPISMCDMFTLFGLNTEPRVVHQDKIQSETLLRHLKSGIMRNMTPGTEPDFRIMLHDRSYKIECHKLILYSKWSYFRRMLESGLSESSTGEMIMSEDWNSTRLYDFVKYLYTHEVGFESLEDSDWLLKNAELYELMETPNNGSSEKIAKQDYQLLIETCTKRAFEVMQKD